MADLLVTGTTSGLGKYIASVTQCHSWNRGEPIPERYYHTVIHCAHDRTSPYQNLDILERLFAIPCRKFVYISSIDVHQPSSMYAMNKMRCERFVRSSYDDYLIVRPGAMIGKYARPNTIMKMLRDEALTVNAESTFGLVHHSEVWQAINLMPEKTITVSGDIHTLEHYAKTYGKNPQYGNFFYKSPEVQAGYSSQRAIETYLKEITPDRTSLLQAQSDGQ